MHVMGAVQAGSANATFQLDEYHPDLDFLWSRSSGWSYSKGPVHYIRVIGDSMEPVYPEGGIIAVRQWNHNELPHSTPVVLLDKRTHASTLKLYQKKIIKGQPVIVGVPVNPIHETQIWRPHEVEIQLVVLGKAEPLSVREIRQNGSRFVLRDSSPEE
jgi:hypothetical protein